MCFFLPFVAPGLLSGSIFQGTGKGYYSLVTSIFRTLVFCAVFAYLFAFTLGLGEAGVWWGIVAGDTLGGIFAYIWAHYYLKRLIEINRE